MTSLTCSDDTLSASEFISMSDGDAFHRGYAAAQYVVYPAVGAGLFYGQYVAYIFDHAYHPAIAGRVGTYVAYIAVAQVVAARTAVYFVGKADKGFGKAVYLFRFAAQQVESHSEGGFAPYSWKGGYLFYCQRKYFGRIFACHCFFS